MPLKRLSIFARTTFNILIIRDNIVSMLSVEN